MPDRVLLEDANEITITNHNETDEILGNPPGWILSWGISLIFVGVIIFGAISWVIKYPDVITSNITISTSNPPILVVSKTSGKITNLNVINNQEVVEDEMIAIIDNTANLDNIEILEIFLADLSNIRSTRKYLYVEPNEDLELGDIQNNYTELIQKIYDYQYFLRSSGVFKKINSLDSQIENTQQLNSNLQQQKSRLEKEVELANTNLTRHQTLNKEGLVADLALENIETQYLQYKRQLDNIENQIVNNEIQTDQLNVQIVDLSENRKDGRQSREMEIKKNIEQLKSEIEKWKETYLITSPISGKISFSKIWSEQQFVNVNEEIFTIVPEKGIGRTVGKAILPIENSGKVQIDQAVNIRLHGFPFQEFGVITTKVENISLVPVAINAENPASYILEVDLPDTLVTNYGKVIPFRQEMQGVANIITEDRRVLERIFDRVNSILKN